MASAIASRVRVLVTCIGLHGRGGLWRRGGETEHGAHRAKDPGIYQLQSESLRPCPPAWSETEKSSLLIHCAPAGGRLELLSR